jgi:transposase
MTYSLDFRKKVLLTRQREGLSFAAVSVRFGINKSSVVRWDKKIESKKHRNKPTITVDMEALKQDLSLYPDSYQYERASRLGVSQSGVYWALKRLGVTYKKNPETPKGRRREAIII